MSFSNRVRVGVCIVKVELQPDHLVITCTTNRNLDRNMYSARPDAIQRFATTEGAVEAVTDFLQRFEDLVNGS